MHQIDIDLAAGNALFHGVDFSCICDMLEDCEVRDLHTGEALLRPDTPSNHLYLILSGELSVHLEAPNADKYTTLPAGGCAGDISLVDGKLPSALVIATRPSRILAIPRDTVWSLVARSHEIARNLLIIVAGRTRQDNRALVSTQHSKLQLEHEASVDPLTGIHNRRWMCESFPRALLRCARNRQPASLIIVDVDFFKQVNDNHGHLIGDAVLAAVAMRLSKNLRPTDLLVRYGGEEFAILLPETGEQDAAALAERLRKHVAANGIACDAVSLPITVSLGVACSRISDLALEKLLDAADRALYAAKHNGRNRVEVSTPEGTVNV